MKTSPHRSTKRRHFHRNHPNNQLLVIDTSLGRKKQPLPPPIPLRPAPNITTLAPSAVAAVQSYHQQQQPPHLHRGGPPSPPAHLRASITTAPPPPSQQQQLQQQLAIPAPAHFILYTPSLHNQHMQLQQQRLSIFQQYAIHVPAIAAKGSSSSTYYVPAYSLRPHQQQQYLTTRNSIRKPGHRYSTRSSQPRINQAPPLTEFWNDDSSIDSSNRASTLFKSPTKFSKGSWNPKKIYQAFRNNGTAYQQQQQQQVRPRSDPSASINDDVTQPTAKANTSFIYLGFAAYMITSVMLAYNGIMSVLLLQASRAPDDTNVPIFIFWLVYLFTAMLSIFGFLALSLSSWTLLRVFHTMYLFTAVLTFTLMLAWLGVNQQQTGAWDRILLDHSFYPSSFFTPSIAFEQHEIWLKSFLVRDAETGTWIISVAEWILAFLGIFLIQAASWYWGLLAYDRQVRDRKLKEKNTNAGGGAPRSLTTVSEKV